MRCRSSSMIFSALPAIWVFLLRGETRHRIFAAKTKHARPDRKRSFAYRPIVDGPQGLRHRRALQEWLTRWRVGQVVPLRLDTSADTGAVLKIGDWYGVYRVCQED